MDLGAINIGTWGLPKISGVLDLRADYIHLFTISHSDFRLVA